jgi:hypothetical protein
LGKRHKTSFLAKFGERNDKRVSSPDEKANTYGKKLVILKYYFYPKSINLPKPLGSQRL